MVAPALGVSMAPREREATCQVRLTVTPFSRTCPNGGTGRRACLVSACRKRRAGSNPASGTPSYRDLTRRSGQPIVLLLTRCAHRLRPATEPAVPIGPRVLCFARTHAAERLPNSAPLSRGDFRRRRKRGSVSRRQVVSIRTRRAGADLSCQSSMALAPSPRPLRSWIAAIANLPDGLTSGRYTM